MYGYYETFKPDEVIKYLRKSRADDPMQTVEEVLEKHNQILNDWENRNLDSPVPEENVYKEVVSGETLADRPEMQKILKRIESPKIKAILVVEVQRLSRGDLEDCGKLMKILRFTRTKVITPMKVYDLEDEYDRDAFERELKRGNEYLEYFKKIQKRGKELSAASGNYQGSVAPYGYNKVLVQEGKKKVPALEINEDEARIVRLIFQWYLEDVGTVNIVRKLDAMGIKPPKGEKWSHNTIRDMLQNVHYIGKIKWNRRKHIYNIENQKVVVSRPKQKEYQIFDGKHPAIIDEETFNKVQVKKQPRINHTKKPLQNPFAGLIYCECGRSMTRRAYTVNKGRSLSAERFQCLNQAVCGNGSVLAETLQNAILDALRDEIENYKVMIKNTSDEDVAKQKEYATLLQDRLSSLEKKEISLWEKYSEEGMPKEIFDTLYAKVTSEKSEVTNALKECLLETKNVDVREKIVTFQQALDAMSDDTIPVIKKNAFLKTVIDRVTYSRPRPQRTGGANHGWDVPDFELKVKLRL